MTTLSNYLKMSVDEQIKMAQNLRNEFEGFLPLELDSDELLIKQDNETNAIALINAETFLYQYHNDKRYEIKEKFNKAYEERRKIGGAKK